MKGRHSCQLAPAAFLLDRATKLLACRLLTPQTPTQAIAGAFRFTLVQNTGAAFSMLAGKQTLLLVITGVAIAAMTAFQLLSADKETPLFRAAMWLLIGGAAGNFFDRIAYGAVIDFIEATFISFPIFNVADICITTAFGLIVLAMLLQEKERKEHG